MTDDKKLDTSVPIDAVAWAERLAVAFYCLRSRAAVIHEGQSRGSFPVKCGVCGLPLSTQTMRTPDGVHTLSRDMWHGVLYHPDGLSSVSRDVVTDALTYATHWREAFPYDSAHAAIGATVERALGVSFPVEGMLPLDEATAVQVIRAFLGIAGADLQRRQLAMMGKVESVQPPQAAPPTFESDIAKLINRYSMENGSNTPDFLLAAYLVGCLTTWNSFIKSYAKMTTQEAQVALDVASSIAPMKTVLDTHRRVRGKIQAVLDKEAKALSLEAPTWLFAAGLSDFLWQLMSGLHWRWAWKGESDERARILAGKPFDEEVSAPASPDSSASKSAPKEGGHE